MINCLCLAKPMTVKYIKSTHQYIMFEIAWCHYCLRRFIRLCRCWQLSRKVIAVVRIHEAVSTFWDGQTRTAPRASPVYRWDMRSAVVCTGAACPLTARSPARRRSALPSKAILWADRKEGSHDEHDGWGDGATPRNRCLYAPSAWKRIDCWLTRLNSSSKLSWRSRWAFAQSRLSRF